MSTSPAVDLTDSYDRLEWVKRLVTQATPSVDLLVKQTRRGPVVVERQTIGEWTHARLALHEPIPVGVELGFIVADIAVNCRSCLDMATTRIVEYYDAPIRHPQFPISDDREMPDNFMKELQKHLPADIAEAFLSLQPTHQTQFGYIDIPYNSQAHVIRGVANRNKHRNITPVARVSSIRGLRNTALPVELVSIEDSLAWQHDGTICEVRYPSSAIVVDDDLIAVASGDLNVQIVNEAVHYGGDDKGLIEKGGGSMPVSVVGFLRGAPRFVHHALEVLTYATTEGQRGNKPGPFVSLQ